MKRNKLLSFVCKKLMTIVLFGHLLLIPHQVGYAQTGQIIPHDTGQLYFRTLGDGTPILIINGGPGMSSEGFVPLAKKLAENNRTIIYDQRGTGLSSLGSVERSTITMDLMVEDIETLRRHLGYQDWIVFGHSFGGMLAYYYASKYPERVSAMIQSSSGGMDLALLSSINITEGLSEMQRDSLSFYNAKIAAGDHSYETRLKRGQFLAPAYLFNQEFVPVIAERLTQGNRRINALVWQNLRDIEFDTKPDLGLFDKPTLIIQGAQDVVGTDIARTAHQVLPNSNLFVLDRCRHYGWLDRPTKYFAIVEKFLTEVENQQSGSTGN